MQTISTFELRDKIGLDEDFTLIDVRDESELRYGMIPTAQHIPLKELFTALKLVPSKFEKVYNFPKPAKKTPIVFYCRVGNESIFACQIAEELGFQTFHYSGGIWAWSQIDPNVKRYGNPPPRTVENR